MRGLLIAEKPSVMREVESVYRKEASSLPFTLEFAAFHGHLMQLQEPEDYDPTWSDWSVLPILPTSFRYKAADIKSVNLLTGKIKAGHYDFLVNACDAAREGEHIFWSFYETQGLTLPVKRFWATSVTVPSIRKALYDLRDSKDYDGMRQAAKYRAQFDWLSGMNFTRAVSNRQGELMSIGRVQSPTLKLIVDRELQIRGFKPEDFYELKGCFKVNGVEFEAVNLIAPAYKDTHYAARTDAAAVEAAVKGKSPGSIAEVNREMKSVPAPTLYSLTELQKAANRYLKFKPDKTLSIAQKLYENGLLTYPRTESRFLPTDMIPEIPAHIAPLKAVPGLTSYAAAIGQVEIDRMLKGKYVDDAGITDHHAIIPTDKIPDWASLSKDEQELYTLVGKSFVAIFMPPHQSAVSTILINVGGYIFKAHGIENIDPGYSVLYPRTAKKEERLPACNKGDKADLVKTKISKGTTKPPARYSPDTILSAMVNVGQNLPDSMMRSILRETAGIGTPATRADILKKLEEREYVKFEKNAYYALEKGIHLIEVVGDRTFCSAALTAQWEEKLLGIEKGTYQGNFRQDMERYIKEETAYLMTNLKSTVGNVIGVCPFCGGNIIDRGRMYACEHRDRNNPDTCQVWIPKAIGGYTLTQKDLDALLAGQPTEPHRFSGKGKTWETTLVLNQGKGTVFGAHSRIIGVCPFCGGAIRDYGKICVCENRVRNDPSTCQAWFPKELAGYTFNEEDIQTLLTGRPTSVKQFALKGKKWEAALILDREKGSRYFFPERKTVGKCPVCGRAVIETKNGYVCEGRRRDVENPCNFGIPKTVGGVKLSGRDIQLLLTNQPTEPRFIKKKQGEPWKVSFYIDESGTFQVRDKTDREEVGPCPLCGNPVYAGGNRFYCSATNHCQWTFPRTIKGTRLENTDIARMLQGGKTKPLTFTWSNGTTGTASLYLENGELCWDFIH